MFGYPCSPQPAGETRVRTASFHSTPLPSWLPAGPGGYGFRTVARAPLFCLTTPATCGESTVSEPERAAFSRGLTNGARIDTHLPMASLAAREHQCRLVPRSSPTGIEPIQTAVSCEPTLKPRSASSRSPHPATAAMFGALQDPAPVQTGRLLDRGYVRRARWRAGRVRRQRLAAQLAPEARL